jgi:hypothetical protein
MMPREGSNRAAQYWVGGLLAALVGLGVVYRQTATLLAAAAACLAGILLLGRSRATDYACFLALFSGPPRIRARDPVDSLRGEIDWVVLLHLAVWLFGALWVIREWRLLAVERKALPFTRIHLLAVVLAAALGLSLFVSPGPWLTLFRSLQLLTMVMFGFLWVEKQGVEGALRSLFWGYLAVGLAIGAAALVRPELVFAGERLRGDYIANTSGAGALGIILLSCHPPRLHRWLAVAIMALFVALLVLSTTRAAYIVVALFLVLAAIRRPDVPALTFINVALALALVVLLLFGLMPIVTSWLIRDPTSLRSFSGRIPLWEFLVPVMWQKSPLIGLGFYAASRVYGLQFNVGIGTAHSAFVEILVGGGVISCALFLAVVGAGLRRSAAAFTRDGKDPRVFVTFVLLLGLVCLGIVSEEMVIASPTALTFWIVMSVALRQARDGATLEAPAEAAG